MNDIAIKTHSVSKKYRLFESKSDRLKEAISITKKKYHKDFWALKDISFEIKKGEVIGVLGKNGSGKSTLLQIISGIKNPTSGNVDVNGKLASILELGIDFNPELSGKDNLILKGIMNGLSEKDIIKNLPNIIEFASIGEYINQPVACYSSGMLVRVAFASCISLQPNILIVDEALSVGDLEFQIKCINWMKEFVNIGNTLIFVTHDLQLLSSLCEKTLLLHKGEEVAFDKTQICTEMYIDLMNKENVEEREIVNKKNQFDSLIAYGDIHAKIIKMELINENLMETDKYNFNEICKVSLSIKLLHEDADSHLLFLIRDIKGYNIYGKWIDISNLSFKEKGKYVIAEIEIKLRMALSEGSYGITISVNKKQMHITTEILERHVAAKYIYISNSPKNLHGAVDLERI